MASFEQRINREGNPVVRVRVRMKGYPTRTAQFPTLKAARRWARITEAAMLEGRHLKTADAARRTVADLIDRYTKEILPHKASRTAKYQGQQLSWWRGQLGYLFLSDLTPDHIAEQIVTLSQGRGNATIRRYLSVLGHALNIAVKRWQWIAENPMRRITKPPEPRGRVRFLSEDERERLLQACQESRSPYLYTVVVLALSTGARKMELLSLVWSQIDIQRGIIHLHETKNRERRTLQITGHALDLMRQHTKMKQADTALVFPGRRGNKPIYIRDAFEAAVKRAVIEDFVWHDLRHSAASYLAMNGASLAEIAEILGHKSLEVTRRYAHLSEGHTRKVVTEMNTWIFGDQV